MALLKSKKLRIGLSVFAALVLIVVVGGFALSRGYLIHFLIDDQTVSHDDYYHLYEDAEQGQLVNLACAQGEPTLGWLYVYEVHCFSSEAAMRAYMKQHYGSS